MCNFRGGHIEVTGSLHGHLGRYGPYHVQTCTSSLISMSYKFSCKPKPYNSESIHFVS